VSAHSDERRLGLDGLKQRQKLLPLERVLHSFLEIGQKPGRSFDSDHPLKIEAGLPDFVGQLIGSMEKGVREIMSG
jgi:hypothetical protein